MVIKVHGSLFTACTSRVLACLHEMELDYEIVPIDFSSQAHKQQPYLSLNPFGQAPALEDDNITLFESRAITRYLARKYKDTGTDLLRLNNLTEAAIVETWMEVESHHYDGPISTIVRQILINPYFGRVSDEKIIQIEVEKLVKVLDVYEERLSKFKYLAGDHFSMADLHHIAYTVLFMKTPKSNLITSRPHLNAWWNDISSRPKLIKVVNGLMFRDLGSLNILSKK
ncbi:hypothetical protein AQUCO_01700217v1 [Aquilegia coerulea]|uniref:glutathione transferase n=1 Tax=Aquilegia coerulea TaxID=218851 RepID=A0A2G5DLV3_AQUCA|nr:hypothetical protein AQUCO_01700217v1 [Aquilegia coerulea]